MSKNIESQSNVGSNEDVAAVSLLTLYVDNIDESDKQDIFTNIKFDKIVSSIEKYLFQKLIIDFWIN